MSNQKFISIFFVLITAIVHESMAGKPQKIISGMNVNRLEFPYQVSIRLNGSHICGGAIISEFHILTAAHCIVDETLESLTVVTGSIQRKNGTIHNLYRGSWHDDYIADKKHSWQHDIAVLTVESPIIFNEYQKPIKLASQEYKNGSPVVLAGWGTQGYFKSEHSETLLKIHTKLTNIKECEEKIKSVLRSDQLCTIQKNEVKGSCNGDSGGPLVTDSDKKPEVIGIMSFSGFCGRFADVYTKVYSHLNFIQKEIEIYPLS